MADIFDQVAGTSSKQPGGDIFDQVAGGSPPSPKGIPQNGGMVASHVPGERLIPAESTFKSVGRKALIGAGAGIGGVVGATASLPIGAIPGAGLGIGLGGSIGKGIGDLAFGPKPESEADKTPTRPQGANVLESMGVGLRQLPKTVPRSVENLSTVPYDIAKSITTPAMQGDFSGAAKATGQAAKGLVEFPLHASGVSDVYRNVTEGKAPFSDMRNVQGMIEEHPIEIPLALEMGAKGIEGIHTGVKGALGKFDPTKFENAKNLDRSITDDISKAIRPSVDGQRTYKQREGYRNKAVDAVRTIAEFKNDLALTDDTGAISKGRLPKTLGQFSEAIGQAKAKVYRLYNDMTQESTGKGVEIDLQPVASELSQIANDPVFRDNAPQAASYASKRAKALSNRGTYTPDQLEDAIAIYNNSLKAFYKKPSPDRATHATIDALAVNVMRKSLDSAIEGAVGEGYQGLKNKYGSLSAIERDVNQRAVVDARKNAKGLVDFSDILTAKHAIVAIAKMDPAAMAGAGAMKATAAYIKRMNDPNRRIAKMFERVDKYGNSEGSSTLAGRLSKRGKDAFGKVVNVQDIKDRFNSQLASDTEIGIKGPNAVEQPEAPIPPTEPSPRNPGGTTPEIERGVTPAVPMQYGDVELRPGMSGEQTPLTGTLDNRVQQLGTGFPNGQPYPDIAPMGKPGELAGQGVVFHERRPNAEPQMPFYEMTDADRYTVPSSRQKSAQRLRDAIAEGRPGYRFASQMDDGSMVGGKEPSTYPEYFKNKGYTQKETLNVMDKHLRGEKLTHRQQVVYDDLMSGHRGQEAEQLRSFRRNEKSEKAQAAIDNLSEIYTDPAYSTDEALSYFDDLIKEREATSGRPNESQNTGGVAEPSPGGSLGTAQGDTGRPAIPSAEPQLPGVTGQRSFGKGPAKTGGQQVGTSALMDGFTPEESIQPQLNASGESSASIEALNVNKSRAKQGIKMMVIDSRSGKQRPAIGPRPEDNSINPYEVLVQVGADGRQVVLNKGARAGNIDLRSRRDAMKGQP